MQDALRPIYPWEYPDPLPIDYDPFSIDPNPWRGPDHRLLEYIARGYPVEFADVLTLWCKTESYVAIEAVLDLALTQCMPIWAAWQVWSSWWHQNYQPD